MPIQNNKYVAPSWVNNSSPYINASELQAISDTIALVPVANGGTGATTAAQALTNLGALPKSNVTSAGTSNTPVYFNSNGEAVALTQPIPIALGGTHCTNIKDVNDTFQLVNFLSGALTSDVGSTIRPVYVKYNGDHMHYVAQCSYTLEKSVPANAVFTDTTALGSMTGTLGVNHGGTGSTGVQSSTVTGAGTLLEWGKLKVLVITNKGIGTLGTLPSIARPSIPIEAAAVGVYQGEPIVAKVTLNTNGSVTISNNTNHGSGFSATVAYLVA